MSATDQVNNVDAILREILIDTDLSTIEEGEKVLCFQPGHPDHRQSTELLVQSILQSETKRSPGWYLGKVVEHQGDWLLVEEINPIGLDEEEGEISLWDVNGKEFSVYEITRLPEAIKELIYGIDHLRQFFENGTSQTLEQEFFER